MITIILETSSVRIHLPQEKEKHHFQFEVSYV